MMTPLSRLIVHPVAGSQCSFGPHLPSLGVWVSTPVCGSHASAVHAIMSSVALGVCVIIPLIGSHASSVQRSLSSTLTGLLAHVPMSQTSSVHGSLSSHALFIMQPP